jgi:phosphoketolase
MACRLPSRSPVEHTRRIWSVVRGLKGSTITPFDMVVLNGLDRFHLVGDLIDRPPQ